MKEKTVYKGGVLVYRIQQDSESFFMEENGERKAEIIFQEDQDGDLFIEHTFVHEDLGGRGVGKELVKKVVEKAQSENKRISSSCSYAQKQLEKSDEYRQLLKN